MVDLPTLHQLENIAQRNANIPILSFFTGAGFLDLGVMKAGFDVVWRNENDLSFVEGFEYGMASLGQHVAEVQNTDSIESLEATQIADEAFHRTGRPDVFGIIGGPPCPDFSTGGKNRGREGDHGRLSEVYVNRIIDLQPTFFVFENVPGLVKTEKHRAFLVDLMGRLSVDYLIDINILNALDYGVPQDRERIFLIGFHRAWLKQHYGDEAYRAWWDWNFILELSNTRIITKKHLLAYPKWLPWSAHRIYRDAKQRYAWPDQDPFGEQPQKPAGVPEELMVGPLICNIEEVANLPNGLEGFEPYSEKFLWVREGDVSRKSFKRLHRWRYSPAAAYGNNEVHLHPTQPRRLTVREALRLQCVPDTYALPPGMPLSHKFKTIGNGVPVRLAEAVSHIVMDVLDGRLNSTALDSDQGRNINVVQQYLL